MYGKKYIGVDRTDKIVWTADIGEIDSLREFAIKTKACETANQAADRQCKSKIFILDLHSFNILV